MISLSGARRWVIGIGYVAAFLLADRLALAFAIVPGVSLWYPPPALTLTLLLVFGLRWLPLALFASLLSAFVVYPMPQAWATIAMGLNGTLVFGVVAAGLRRWLGSPPRLETMADALGFVVVLLLAALPTALLGTSILQAVGLSAPEEFGRSMFRWWLGDTAGILSVLPALLINVAPRLAPDASSTPASPPHPKTNRRELAGQALAVVLSLLVLFVWPSMRENYVPYLSFVPLTWIVLRHGLPGAGIGILAINVGTVCVLKLTGTPEPILVSFLLFQFATAAMGLGLGAMVTRRQRAETEKNRLLEIIEATPDFIVTTAADGTVIYCNTALRNLLDEGTTLAGSPLTALHPPWAAEKILREGIPAALAQGRWTGETAFLDRNGREIPVSQVIVPHRETAGGSAPLFTVARDISAQKRAEADRLDRERKMLHAQKLESLGTLAGGIAHDFNNILTAVIGNAGLSRIDLPPDSPVQAHLQQIERAALRAAELCKQMLAYSGRGRFGIAAVDLSTLIQNTAHLLQVSIPKKTRLKLELAENLPAVRGDAAQLRQVVMNLVLNAAEAIGDESGTISIATGVMRADPAWLNTGVVTPPPPPGDYVYLEVIDDGRGMSAETRARIFEPFFTTKFTGHGLGLSAALGIVRGHGGTLRVHSELNLGSRFRVAFPASPAETPRAVAPAPAATPWRGGGTLLLADDEENVRIVTARVLEHAGFQVEMVADGREAVKAFARNPLRYRAVLLDLLMPVLDGEQALEEIRAIRGDIPVLLLSGYSGGRNLSPDMTARTLFLGKPFTGPTLIAVTRELLEARR